MPRVKKKVPSKGKSRLVEQPAAKVPQRSAEPRLRVAGPASSPAKSIPLKNGQRKRGWRDIEAISERARLKKMLTDIWHEDIELDDDIFGDSDHLSGYYTDFDEVVVEIDTSEDLIDDPVEFEEKAD